MRRICPKPLRATAAAACLLAAGTTPLGAATRTWDASHAGATVRSPRAVPAKTADRR